MPQKLYLLTGSGSGGLCFQVRLDYKKCIACTSQTAPFFSSVADAAWLVCRDKYRDSVSTPMLPGDPVQMYFKDSSDPTTGKWYTGQVVDQAKFDYKAPATLWDSVTVVWEDASTSSQLFSKASSA